MARISLIRQIEEPRFARVIAKQFNLQRRAVLEEVKKDMPQIDDLFWEEHSNNLISAILPMLIGIYDRAAARTIGQTPMKQDLIGAIASRAARWARRYAGELIPGLMRNTRDTVREALVSFVSTPGMLIRDFADMLDPIFGTNRAMTIAVTEFTRAHFEGQAALAEEVGRVGFQMIGIWLTANDERVCQICGPLNGTRESNVGSRQWGPDNISPPAHPNCRCDIGYEMI